MTPNELGGYASVNGHQHHNTPSMVAIALLAPLAFFFHGYLCRLTRLLVAFHTTKQVTHEYKMHFRLTEQVMGYFHSPSDQATSTVSAFTLARSAEIIRSHGALQSLNVNSIPVNQCLTSSRISTTRFRTLFSCLTPWMATGLLSVWIRWHMRQQR